MTVADCIKDIIDINGLVIKVDTENLLNNKMKKKEGYSNLFKGYLDFVPNVKKIIHSGRCTIVIWTDGSKTIVKQSENDDWDEYAAFCAAFCKKIFGSTSAVKRMIDKKTVAYRPTNKEKKEDETNDATFFKKIFDSASAVKKMIDKKNEDERLANLSGYIIVTKSKDQADKWKKEIINRINNFGRISIAGLYEIVDIKRSPSFTNFDYGWDDVNDIRYVKKSNEYWFNLPKPKRFKIDDWVTIKAGAGEEEEKK